MSRNSVSRMSYENLLPYFKQSIFGFHQLLVTLAFVAGVGAGVKLHLFHTGIF